MTIPAATESCRAQAPLKSDDEKLAQAIHLAALDRNAARLAAEQSSTPLELLSLLQAGASACPNPVCREINTTKGKRALFAVRRFERPVDGASHHLHIPCWLGHVRF